VNELREIWIEHRVPGDVNATVTNIVDALELDVEQCHVLWPMLTKACRQFEFDNERRQTGSNSPGLRGALSNLTREIVEENRGADS
jgi:hypothetical protein